MKRVFGAVVVLILLLGSATAGLCDLAVQIFYQLTPQGGYVWEYSYTVHNNSLTEDGGVTMFNAYFPNNDLYTNLQAVGTLP